ncbi:uncharacterized protein LOC107487314 [Arachis duranensis]|uniref:Uncharacterized protein LOC107487314 n=1 Tax=Arachis duranensis TaxID=130453 RepID=A0A6P4D9A3_ARADU|nr:uncharacterized protein LOC107487314 [Arachis duranensis]
MSFAEFLNSIIQKLGLQGVKRVEKLFNCISISVLREDAKYDSFVIGNDEDLEVLFHCRRQFPDVRTPELLAKLVDVVSSSDGSNRNPQTPETAICSSLSGDEEVGIIDTASVSLHGGTPDGINHVLPDDDDADDVDLNIVANDSGDDIAANKEGIPGEPVGFSARDTQGTRGLSEFQVGQQFQDKEEAVLSVKTYSIRCGVQYKVVESNYRKYIGKCKEFGNGCTWLIRINLSHRKGIWEVKRYNGPYTCLATSISSDHRILDYHVISAFILTMVRADVAVCIKVLLNTTEAHFGFRPTYRRVWLAKQKTVAHIYGDWDELYNELLQWVLGVQMKMPGNVAVLRTNPVGTLLVVIAQDRNSNILPIAFALVEGENAESWSFFLSHIRQHVTPQSGILVISDRHNGIKATHESPDGGWLPPASYRTICIRHAAYRALYTS